MGQTLKEDPRVGIIQPWGLCPRRVSFFCCVLMNNLVLSLCDVDFSLGRCYFFDLNNT